MDQTNATITAQAGTQPAQASGQTPNAALNNTKSSDLVGIIQQVAQLKESLHNFVENEDFPDARVISASGVLEAHLNKYYELAVEKENMKPGLQTF